MKRQNFFFQFTILLLLGVLFTGCGKDSGSSNTASATTTQQPINELPTVPGGVSGCEQAFSKSDLVAALQSGSIPFGVGTFYYQNCSTKDRWIDVTKCSLKSRSSSSHELGSTRDSLVNALVSKVNSSVQHVYNAAGTYHRIWFSDGGFWDLNLCQPLAAQPVIKHRIR